LPVPEVPPAGVVDLQGMALALRQGLDAAQQPVERVPVAVADAGLTVSQVAVLDTSCVSLFATYSAALTARRARRGRPAGARRGWLWTRSR
jgi:hypothetical protein